MTNPFPGMNPYLEDPAHWRGFHNMFIAFLTVAVNVVLPDGFVAESEERCYPLTVSDEIYPDAVVLRRFVAEPKGGILESAEKSSLLNAPESSTLLPSPPLMFRKTAEEQREMYLKIVRAKDEAQVVTIIEVLSPANKAGGAGRREYQRKQRSVLNSDSHLLEIDLLRAGQHTVAMEREPIAAQKSFDYLVCLARVASEAERVYLCWAFTMRELMPVIRIPLLADVPDVLLDLNPILEQLYQGGRYDKRIDYKREPVPALSSEDAVWADGLLRAKGLRTD